MRPNRSKQLGPSVEVTFGRGDVSLQAVSEGAPFGRPMTPPSAESSSKATTANRSCGACRSACALRAAGRGTAGDQRDAG